MKHSTRTRVRTLGAAAIAATLIGGGLASCSTGTGTSDGVTTITFWNGFTGPDGATLKARVAAFNASQKNYKVKMSIMPGDVLGEKLFPALGAHKGPSLVVVGAESVGQYVTKGAFADLSEYWAGWKDASSLFPADAAATKFDGKHYAVPMTFTPVVTYYNKKLFAAAGLDPNSPPTTWQEYQDDAVKLTKDVDGDGKPDQYGFVLPDHTSPPIWESLMWGNGGGTVSEDGKTSTIQDPASIEAVTTWANLLKSKQISPAGISGPDADALFQSGKVGMLSEGPWMINGFKSAGLDFGITNVPEGPKGAIPAASAVMFFVSKDAWASPQQKKASEAFLTFWNSKSNQLAWSTGSGNPPTRKDITVADVSAKAPEMAEFMKYRDKARFFLPYTTNAGDITSSIYEASMEKITAGKGDPEEVMTAAGQQLTKLLSAAK